jgi:probable rRNA maturation factor
VSVSDGGAGPSIEILVDTGRWPETWERDVAAAARAACRAMGAHEAEVSIALLGDEAMTALGRQHLGTGYPTDVIAFSLYGKGEPVLGDVYIGVEQAERQAREAGVGLAEELVRLAVHGTLHVLGLDHPDDADEREASPMYRTQEALVAELVSGGGER